MIIEQISFIPIFFNNDSQINPTPGWVDILFNNGDNTFNVQHIFTLDTFDPFRIAVADVNSDEKLDIIIFINFINGHSEMIVFLDSGNNKFIEKRNDFYSSYVVEITMANLNNDDKPHIIISNCCLTNISILFNTDNGTYYGKSRLLHWL